MCEIILTNVLRMEELCQEQEAFTILSQSQLQPYHLSVDTSEDTEFNGIFNIIKDGKENSSFEVEHNRQ